MILSVGMMFNWIGLRKKNDLFLKGSKYIKIAVEHHFEEFQYLTPDLDGNATTKDVTKSILEKIKLLN